MNLENKLSCGVMVVMIGRESCIDPLFQYFKDVEIPEGFKHLNLYVVKAWNPEFDLIFQTKLKEYKLKNKFKKIKIIEGTCKVNNHFTWEDWENSVRVLSPYQKHESTAYNLDLGIAKAIEGNDVVHVLDDDTIPPPNALNDLWNLLSSNDSYGITSGFYFDKGWVPPNFQNGEQESIRKLVVSLDENKWKTSVLDDFINTDKKDVGFVGNGCMLTHSYLLENSIPLKGDGIAKQEGPDQTLCKRIRKQNKKIVMVPTVFCKHLDEKGNEVGLTSDYFNKVINSTTTTKIAITSYERMLNYDTLASEFDTVYVVINTDNSFNIKSYFKKHMQMLNKIPNIKIIESSISQYRSLYNHYKGHINNVKYRTLLEKANEIINTSTDYDITIFKSPTQPFNSLKIPSLNHQNLKKYLTQN